MQFQGTYPLDIYISDASSMLIIFTAPGAIFYISDDAAKDM
jgi:hypothetical protein